MHKLATIILNPSFGLYAGEVGVGLVIVFVVLIYLARLGDKHKENTK